eukprot:g5086.t1
MSSGLDGSASDLSNRGDMIEKVKELVQQRDSDIDALKKRTQADLAGVGKKNRKKKRLILEKASREENYIKDKCDEMLDDFGEDVVREALDALKSLTIEAEKAKETTLATSPLPEKKASRSQRRREAKDQKRKIKDKEVEKLRKSLAGSSLREREVKELSIKLDRDGLDMLEIPSDGHCMYRAIAHQLGLTGSELVDRKAKDSYLKIRRIAARYMRDNKDEFAPYMTVPSGKSAESAFADHCSSVEASAEWGGQLELRAISEALKTPIHIYAADAPLIRMGDSYGSSPLRLTYHKHYYALGEHYNTTTTKAH